MPAPRMTRRIALSLALAACAVAACESPDVYIPFAQFGGPAGVIEGSVTYSGPPPCTRDGHVVGAAVLLAFDTQLLPPPEGLGTSAASLAVVSGDRLFAGIRGRLPNNGCPEPGADPVTVSATWAIGPFPGGIYQIRGFYDLDGDFDPGFSISNLPTKGDVGGGAIDNVAEVLQGAAPRYREIQLGAPDENGNLTIPETGAHVGGVSVTLGLQLPTERPVFHVGALLTGGTTTDNPDSVVMPADFRLQELTNLNSFITVRLDAGVYDEEVEAAAKSPFFFPVQEATPPSIFYSRQDVNGDGAIDAEDHVIESTAVPSLFPLGVFSKLTEGSALVAQSSPVVVIQGLTVYKSLLDTAGLLSQPTIAEPEQPEALIAVRPSALCLHPTQPERGGVLVVTHPTDVMGDTPIIPDETAIEAVLSAQFGRDIQIVYGCLPQGRYAMNLIYPTGQAWTVPNEAGVCAPSEEPSGGKCGTRARLASQSVVLTIDAPTDPAYCEMNPAPELCRP